MYLRKDKAIYSCLSLGINLILLLLIYFLLGKFNAFGNCFTGDCWVNLSGVGEMRLVVYGLISFLVLSFFINLLVYLFIFRKKISKFSFVLPLLPMFFLPVLLVVLILLVN